MMPIINFQSETRLERQEKKKFASFRLANIFRKMNGPSIKKALIVYNIVRNIHLPWRE
jgi:hypothetical protein